MTNLTKPAPLRGAAAKSAIALLDKQLSPAEQAVETATAELEQALIAGKDTADIRARLRLALNERARINDEREARYQQAERRKQQKIADAASALAAASNASVQHLLAGYEFQLN